MGKGDNRFEVLGAAKRGGWDLDHQSFDGGNILRDTFTGIPGVVRVVWLRTPWTDTGRFAGAVFSDRMRRTDRNVWSLRGNNGLIPMLVAGSIERIGQSDRRA